MLGFMTKIGVVHEHPILVELDWVFVGFLVAWSLVNGVGFAV